MGRLFFAGCLICCYHFVLLSQNSVGLRFVFSTIHPSGDDMAFLMPNKLNERANVVLNWGFIGSYQHYLYRKRIAIKLAQGAYSDCANLFAGHTHLGFRLNVLSGRRQYLELGFGPTLVYRETWHKLEGYIQQTKLLKNSKNWQYNFVWYGGEIEYDLAINNNLDLNINCIPGYPDFMTFAVGVRYWLQPIAANRDWKENNTYLK